MALKWVGLEPSALHYILLAVVLLWIFVVIRLALMNTPRVAIGSLEWVPARQSFSASVAKVGFGEINYTVRLKIDGDPESPFVLQSHQRAKEKDTSPARISGGADPKRFTFLKYDPLNQKLVIPHRGGDYILPVGLYLLTLSVDDVNHVVERRISVTPSTPRGSVRSIYVSDGKSGFEFQAPERSLLLIAMEAINETAQPRD